MVAIGVRSLLAFGEGKYKGEHTGYQQMLVCGKRRVVLFLSLAERGRLMLTHEKPVLLWCEYCH